MNQLFYNLVNNALKFSKKNTPPKIEIYSKTVTADELASHPELNKKGTSTEIVVEDNVTGFNQKYASQVIDLFHRLHNR